MARELEFMLPVQTMHCKAFRFLFKFLLHTDNNLSQDLNLLNLSMMDGLQERQGIYKVKWASLKQIPMTPSFKEAVSWVGFMWGHQGWVVAWTSGELLLFSEPCCRGSGQHINGSPCPQFLVRNRLKTGRDSVLYMRVYTCHPSLQWTLARSFSNCSRGLSLQAQLASVKPTRLVLIKSVHSVYK